MIAVICDTGAILFVIAGGWQIYIGNLYRKANISYIKGREVSEHTGNHDNVFYLQGDRLYNRAQRLAKMTAPWQYIKDKTKN